MSMKDYWNKSEIDRALEIGDAEFADLERAELMRAGLPLDIPTPELEPEPSVDVPVDGTVFEVHAADPGETYQHNTGIVFPTAEKAQAFIDLEPWKTETEYLDGKSFASGKRPQVTTAAPRCCFSIRPVRVSAAGTVEAHKDAIAERQRIAERNSRALSRHAGDVKRRDEALARMRRDRASLRERLMYAERVVRLFASYVETAGGDRAVASRFLRRNATREIGEDYRKYDDTPLHDAIAWGLLDGYVPATTDAAADDEHASDQAMIDDVLKAREADANKVPA